MNSFDPEDQDQLEQLKSFWRRKGGLILLVLAATMVTVFIWQQWQQRQEHQALQAAAMFDELDLAAAANDAKRSLEVFNDLKNSYPKTFFAQQGALLAAKVLASAGQLEQARTSLVWAKDHALENEYKAIAVLRLSAVLIELKQLDEAKGLLLVAPSQAFEGLFADLRGDILQKQNQKKEAIDAYQQALKAFASDAEYAYFVRAKLATLGVLVPRPKAIDVLAQKEQS